MSCRVYDALFAVYQLYQLTLVYLAVSISLIVCVPAPPVSLSPARSIHVVWFRRGLSESPSIGWPCRV